MPPKYRGTRPTTPAPWPRRAENYRQDMYDAAGEILGRVGRVRDKAHTNIYLTERMLAEIAELAQYIQRLALEAKMLGPHEHETEEDDGDLAALVRAEVARQLADLDLSNAPRITPMRRSAE